MALLRDQLTDHNYMPILDQDCTAPDLIVTTEILKRDLRCTPCLASAFRQRKLPLTPPHPYQHNLVSLPQVNHTERGMNPFTDMVHLKLGNDPPSIGMALEHFTSRQNCGDEIVTDLRHALFPVVRLDSL